METFLIILLSEIIFFIILFVLIMLWDSWRYENPGWFLLLLFSVLIIVPFLFYLNDLFCYLHKYTGIILYPMEEYRYIRELEVGDFLYLLVFSLIPFSLSFIYYRKKFKSSCLSSRFLFLMLFFFSFFVFLGLRLYFGYR